MVGERGRWIPQATAIGLNGPPRTRSQLEARSSSGSFGRTDLRGLRVPTLPHPISETQAAQGEAARAPRRHSPIGRRTSRPEDPKRAPTTYAAIETPAS